MCATCPAPATAAIINWKRTNLQPACGMRKLLCMFRQYLNHL
jgi:hypothetical protein